MLDKVNLKKRLKKREYETRYDELSIKLGSLQRAAKEAGIPVMVVFEGWRGAMRGTLINKLIESLDPRGFRVYSSSKTTAQQRRFPFFSFFWQHLPNKGGIAIHHRGWYFLKNEHEVGDSDEADEWYNISYEDINAFEKALTDDGYTVVKIFTHLSQKQQEENLKKIDKIYGKAWEDIAPGGVEGLNYKEYGKVYEKMFKKTDTVNAPWHIVSVEDLHTGLIAAFEIIIQALENALSQTKEKKTHKVVINKDLSVPDILGNYVLSDKIIDKKSYSEKLKEMQQRLSTMQFELFKKGIATIVGFEGWDAGGKGGAIKRFTGALDPLGYAVNPVAAPNALENSYNYLWRFWQHVPNSGEIAVFDRTWYGRVLVERVERFARVDEWRRAYQEINDMEAQWAKHGIVVQKFWMQIDKEEQYNRFEARENDPNKKWKITPDDWRNRDKWDAYVDAVNEMLYRTDTKAAPWTVVEANCKYYARLKVLETMIKRYEEVLKK